MLTLSKFLKMINQTKKGFFEKTVWVKVYGGGSVGPRKHLREFSHWDNSKRLKAWSIAVKKVNLPICCRGSWSIPSINGRYSSITQQYYLTDYTSSGNVCSVSLITITLLRQKTWGIIFPHCRSLHRPHK